MPLKKAHRKGGIIHFERKSEPLAPVSVYHKRVFRNLCVGTAIIAAGLAIGILGYHFTTGMAWIDALHNASMILSGMGPVVEIKTDSGKYFSSFYAIFSGVVFITNIGIMIAPAAHRFFHRLHIDDADQAQENG
jgi:hypothetical protein